jgi:beta-lactamase regulating signal transducer with metallopeptidase domain
LILFALRGLTISLSIFVLAYAALRLSVACGWSLTRRRLPWMSPNALYTLQVGPFLSAAMIVGAFTIPSFIRFEPRIVQEVFGPPVIVLSLICLSVLGVGLYRTCQAYARTARIVRQWRENATPVNNPQGLPIYKTGPAAPPLVVAGFWRPKLLISSSISGILSEDELARAISHESAHITRHDNLKKLMLRVCSFPRATQIEQHWLAAVELDADNHAVSNKREALDLASALVKASRLSMPTAELTMNLTSEAGMLLQMRVRRLVAWDAARNSSKLLRYGSLMFGALVTIAMIASYQGILLRMHALTEFLMQ